MIHSWLFHLRGTNIYSHFPFLRVSGVFVVIDLLDCKVVSSSPLEAKEKGLAYQLTVLFSLLNKYLSNTKYVQSTKVYITPYLREERQTHKQCVQ